MARPRILVFQHVPFEPLGTLDPLLRDSGFRVRYINFQREPDSVPSLDGYDGLIVLGGPMNADDVANYPYLATEVELLKKALDRDISIMGICLGAQLLTKALGGEVHRGAVREIGWYDVDLTANGLQDPVLSGFGVRREVFQWHEDVIELPSGIPVLASSADCDIQAFRCGRHAYGFQFHIEVTQPIVERWISETVNAAMLKEEETHIDIDHIMGQMSRSMQPMMMLSRDTFGRWLQTLGDVTKRTALPSR